MAENSNGSGGIGFPELLTICFVVLKLLGVLDWSWWWVLSPILIELGVILFIVVAVLLFSKD